MDILKTPQIRKVDVQEISLKALELIPEDSARYYKMVPLSRTANELEVGMVNPDDSKAQEALKFLARQGNFSYQISLITPASFEVVMKEYRNLRREVTKALEELEEEMSQGSAKSQKESDGFTRIVEEAPITKMVAVILRTAVETRASDIHIEPTRKDLRVRFRLLGQLHSSLILPLRVHPAVISRIKILCNMKIDETRIPQDGRFSTAVESQTIDFRVSTFPTSLGEKVVIRVLDPNAGLQTFEDLGLEGENLAKFKVALRKPYGLVLVTGPTGSGKTTTLYTGLKMLNSEEVNIVSLEDPVEYFIEGVSQSQVRPELGYDFAQGLRQILRQDPDIIMVGEVRDEETATLVIHAALTGHIVLSTLHTNNAIGVIPRLIDMGIEKYLLPAALNLMVAQRLVRRLCAECRQQTSVKKELNDMLLEELKKSPPSFQKRIAPKLKGGKLVAFKAVGCKKCGESGYSGRVALFEVLTMTENLENVILKEPSEAVINEEAKLQGMVTIFQDGILKSLDGVTTIEEVLHVTGLGDDEGRRTGK
ncbi:MAG: Type II secretion system protein E (GspE) [Parcubacteria group bacterium GW2011_GWA1_48_11b]|nr:MAG: Type II secretion system protein E (GspE) [Parcubacteria group bacterium GW2011_GWA1_48_11b]